MKKLVILIVFLGCFSELSAQHYGGLIFTPYAVENSTYYYTRDRIQGDNYTFGYSVGYQGLLMPQRRFSFAYGFQYASGYTDETYTRQHYIPDEDREETITITDRVDVEALQIPLWWRYNIIKNKKWQPFIAFSPTVNFGLKNQFSIERDDGTSESFNNNNAFYLMAEVAIGVNYTSGDWMFTVQPTYSYNYLRQLGVGFSVLKKF